MPNLLSPHELATLLILLHSPAQVVNTNNPHLEALRAESLVEVVAVADTSASSAYRLTDEGNAVLRRLGVA